MNLTEEEINQLENKTQLFHDALNPKQPNEETIVDILSYTTNEQRQIMRGIYKRFYGHPLQNDIPDSLSYKLKELCIDMFDSPFEYDARELHKALSSFMINDKVIIEIFASRPKAHLDIVNVAYNKFYGISLREDLLKDVEKEYIEFLLAIMDTIRPMEQTISGNEAYYLAKKFNENGLKLYGKDVNLFRNVFLEKSREDLILICRAYNELFQKNLYDAIDKEVNGRNRKLLKAILFAVITPGEWYSEKIHKSMEGLGTDVNSLYRAMITRSEIDMYAIRDYYFQLRNTELKADIEGDTSGSYGQVLVNLSVK